MGGEDKTHKEVVIPNRAWTPVSIGDTQIWVHQQSGHELPIHFALRPNVDTILSSSIPIRHRNVFEKES